MEFRPPIEEVAIVIGDDEHFLVPTPRAHRVLDRHFGGAQPALERIARYELRAFTLVIAAGLGKREPEDLKTIEAAIWAHGLNRLIDPVSRYVELLGMGGRIREEDGDPGKKS